ncbi:unnamed protein product, partial [Polarella glacialis]
MASAGTVEFVKILTQDGTEWSRSKGIACVRYASAEEAEKAVATLAGTALMERDITVDKWTSRGGKGDSKEESKGCGLYTKSLTKGSRSAGDFQGMLRSPSGQLLTSLHQESKWEEEGGWRPISKDRRKSHRMERDASMVQLLNLLDPDSLVDKPLDESLGAPSVLSRLDSDSFGEQHSTLSRRGVALVGGVSACGWYLLRLMLRDLFQGSLGGRRGLDVELHALGTCHALGWLVFLIRKMQLPAQNLPKYCSRALAASLGFYLHDCWVLRGTLLNSPAMFAHQASVAVTIASILRSKGVAWLAPALMSLSVPTLVQNLLLLCGSLGVPANRLEVRGLRLLWFASFAASKLALVPLWLQHCDSPELHQPHLLPGKVSYLLGLGLNIFFMLSAARDLPHYLKPAGSIASVAAAYAVPLKGASAVSTTIVASACLGSIFGSYLSAPVAAILALLASRRGASRRLKLLAGGSCAFIALDQLLPMPQECNPAVRYLLPFLRRVKGAFRHRFYPRERLELKNDRHYLLAVTPHGSLLSAFPSDELRSLSCQDIEVSAANLRAGFAELAVRWDAALPSSERVARRALRAAQSKAQDIGDAFSRQVGDSAAVSAPAWVRARRSYRLSGNAGRAGGAEALGGTNAADLRRKQ